MRDSLCKFYVDRANFEIANTYACGEIAYLAKSDEKEIKPFDFIVLEKVGRNGSQIPKGSSEEKGFSDAGTDKSGIQVLRNCCNWNGNVVQYTSVGPCVAGRGDFALCAVVANLYESIQHIRHGVPEKNMPDGRRFPFDLVKAEIAIMELCVNLLENRIDLGKFRQELKEYSALAESYYLESTNALLGEYPWCFRGNATCAGAAGRILAAAGEMKQRLESKEGLGEIWKLAYRIHNEPGKFLEAVL